MDSSIKQQSPRQDYYSQGQANLQEQNQPNPQFQQQQQQQSQMFQQYPQNFNGIHTQQQQPQPQHQLPQHVQGQNVPYPQQIQQQSMYSQKPVIYNPTYTYPESQFAGPYIPYAAPVPISRPGYNNSNLRSTTPESYTTRNDGVLYHKNSESSINQDQSTPQQMQPSSTPNSLPADVNMRLAPSNVPRPMLYPPIMPYTMANGNMMNIPPTPQYIPPQPQMTMQTPMYQYPGLQQQPSIPTYPTQQQLYQQPFPYQQQQFPHQLQVQHQQQMQIHPQQQQQNQAGNVIRTAVPWSNEESRLLMKLRERGLTWKEIASHFTNRTLNACQFRWKRISLNGGIDFENESDVGDDSVSTNENESEIGVGNVTEKTKDVKSSENENTGTQNTTPKVEKVKDISNVSPRTKRSINEDEDNDNNSNRDDEHSAKKPKTNKINVLLNDETDEIDKQKETLKTTTQQTESELKKESTNSVLQLKELINDK